MSFCPIVLDTLFPNTERALKRTMDTVDEDLEDLYKELKEKQQTAHQLKASLKKLNDKSIAMDPNGMTRKDAISSMRSKCKLVLNNIKNIQHQIQVFEGTKYTIENSKMATDMAARIDSLRKRVSNIKNINHNKLTNDVDDIMEAQDYAEKINETINDTMISAWHQDLESDNQLLEEFLADSDDEFDFEEDVATPVKHELKTEPDKVIIENKPNKQQIEEKTESVPIQIF